MNSYLSIIEKEVGLPLEAIEEISSIRVKIIKEFSSVVHSSFMATSLGAFAFGPNESVNPGVCGRASIASQNSLTSLNWLLFYLLMMNKLILKHYHNYKAPSNNKVWRTAIPIRECYIKLYYKIVYNEDFENITMNFT
ncbi:hypothetical protein [Paenibacillus sophorae]|uniref:Uncharacterized protein n=1 Tax=Paenibacillus sophorae TaxID=1333845 RepID=A0ABX8H9V2_9BACL|nr:hypothetical protein [Paenibacillus sophorae]QWU14511.1 hypothetical protein KP014_21645 [Paenibacillus sophorae]